MHFQPAGIVAKMHSQSVKEMVYHSNSVIGLLFLI